MGHPSLRMSIDSDLVVNGEREVPHPLARIATVLLRPQCTLATEVYQRGARIRERGPGSRRKRVEEG